MAGMFCGDFFCSSFFCVATSDVASVAVDIPGGGGPQTYVIARPSILRRRIPRFTRIIQVTITHIYWLSQRIDIKIPSLFTKSMNIIIPIRFNINKKLTMTIPLIHKRWQMVKTRIPTKPHPSIAKKLKSIMEKMKEWQ